MHCRFALLVLCFSMVLVGSPQEPVPANAAHLEGFTSLGPIDTHTHVFQTDPTFLVMLERLHLHVLDILVVNDKSVPREPLDAQRQDALKFVSSSMGHARLCTTFDPFQFNDSNFPQKAIDSINQDFSRGAASIGSPIASGPIQTLPSIPRLAYRILCRGRVAARKIGGLEQAGPLRTAGSPALHQAPR